jgi:uncharacterized delta-60 repeat protein
MSEGLYEEEMTPMNKGVNHKFLVFFLCVLLTIGFTPSANAAQGDLDTSFGVGGKVITSIGTSIDVAYAQVIQQDNKILLAGKTLGVNSFDIALVRYTSNGALDQSFGTNGKVITDIGGRANEAFAIELQADNKILVAGRTNDGSVNSFVLLRYNSNGTLDTSFGVNGIVITSFGEWNAGANSLKIQKDNKIILGGYTSFNTEQDFALVRYLADGSIDLSFGDNGYVQTDFNSTYNSIRAVAIQNDGKIVVTGKADTQMISARYSTQGVLDNNFGTSGFVTTSTGDEESGDSVVIQNDGKIIVVGAITIYAGIINDFIVRRYLTNGQLDPSFGVSGIVQIDFSTNIDQAFSVTLQTDGKILVAGNADNGTNWDFGVVRLNSNGSRDSTFGSNGIVTTDFHPGVTGSDEYVGSIVVQKDGKIVIAGSSVTEGSLDFAIARYLGPNLDNSNSAAKAAAAAEAQRQRELTEILSLVPSIAGLSSSISELTNSLLFKQKCVKGKKAKYVKYGAKCPKGFTKKK